MMQQWRIANIRSQRSPGRLCLHGLELNSDYVVDMAACTAAGEQSTYFFLTKPGMSLQQNTKHAMLHT